MSELIDGSDDTELRGDSTLPSDKGLSRPDDAVGLRFESRPSRMARMAGGGTGVSSLGPAMPTRYRAIQSASDSSPPSCAPSASPSGSRALVPPLVA